MRYITLAMHLAVALKDGIQRAGQEFMKLHYVLEIFKIWLIRPVCSSKSRDRVLSTAANLFLGIL